jgi:hypothetical protein
MSAAPPASRPVYPICNGCLAEIIACTPELTPWAITVTDPNGLELDGGIFCLPCIIEFAKHGLQLHGVRR